MQQIADENVERSHGIESKVKREKERALADKSSRLYSQNYWRISRDRRSIDDDAAVYGRTHGNEGFHARSRDEKARRIGSQSRQDERAIKISRKIRVSYFFLISSAFYLFSCLRWSILNWLRARCARIAKCFSGCSACLGF